MIWTRTTRDAIGLPTCAKTLGLAALTVWLTAGCVTTPKQVGDARIDCTASKQCGEVCRVYADAEDGSAGSQALLGRWYETGEHACVPRDDESALSWYRRAAAQGNASAMYAMGEAYENGRGVPKDPMKAVELYRRAEKAGYDSAWNRFNRSSAKHGPATARQRHSALAARHAPELLRESSKRLSELARLAVATRWKAGEPKLGKPHGGAAVVSGRLASSGAVSLIVPFYGVIMAYGAVMTGIEDGKAGRAVHESLNGFFRQMDLASMVREEMRSALEEANLAVTPEISTPDSQQRSQEPNQVRIELEFENAKIDNVTYAWQFEASRRPGLVLVLDATVRAIRGGAESPMFELPITYQGRNTLGGSEAPFRAEVGNAARYLARTILLRLVELPREEVTPTTSQRYTDVAGGISVRINLNPSSSSVAGLPIASC